VLAFVIPSADTSEQRAAAHGQPFNARELIERAKKNYAGFAGSHGWRRHWRREQRAWTRQWRAARWQSRWAGGAPWAPPPPAGYPARVFAGVALPVLSLMSIAFFWFGLFAIYSLVTSNEVFGTPLPNEIPLWLGVVLIIVVYQAATWPLHAMRRSSYYAIGGTYHGVFAAFDGFLSLGFVVLVVWLAYHFIPEVREILRALPDVWNSFAGSDLRI
jgi:hypothetical protein